MPKQPGSDERRLKKNNERQIISKQRPRTAVFICAMLVAALARADIEFESIGFVEADSVKKFSGMHQHGVSVSYRINSASRRFRVPRMLDLTAGWMERGSDAAPFVSFGPTYRFNLGGDEPGRWYIDFATHPMYVSDSHFGGKDLGGSFFFTSYVGLGACLNRTRTAHLLLRYQHTSNAGLDDVNPGVDMVGLSFTYRLGNRRRSLVQRADRH